VFARSLLNQGTIAFEQGRLSEISFGPIEHGSLPKRVIGNLNPNKTIILI